MGASWTLGAHAAVVTAMTVWEDTLLTAGWDRKLNVFLVGGVLDGVAPELVASLELPRATALSMAASATRIYLACGGADIESVDWHADDASAHASILALERCARPTQHPPSERAAPQCLLDGSLRCAATRAQSPLSPRGRGNSTRAPTTTRSACGTRRAAGKSPRSLPPSNRGAPSVLATACYCRRRARAGAVSRSGGSRSCRRASAHARTRVALPSRT